MSTLTEFPLVSVRLDSPSSGEFSSAFGEFRFLKIHSTLSRLDNSPEEIALKRQALKELAEVIRSPMAISSLFDYSLIPELFLALQSVDPLIRRQTCELLSQLARSRRGREFLLDEFDSHAPNDYHNSAIATVSRLFADSSIQVRLRSAAIIEIICGFKRGALAVLENLKLHRSHKSASQANSSAAEPVDSFVSGSVFGFALTRLAVEQSIPVQIKFLSILSLALQSNSNSLSSPPEADLLIHRFPNLIPSLNSLLEKTINIDEIAHENRKKMEENKNQSESNSAASADEEKSEALEVDSRSTGLCLTMLCRCLFDSSISPLGKRLLVLSDGLIQWLVQLIKNPTANVRSQAAAALVNATNSLAGKVSFISHNGLPALIDRFPIETDNSALANFLALAVNAVEHPLSSVGANAAIRSQSSLHLLSHIRDHNLDRNVQIAVKSLIERIDWRP